jgi:SAM-dependent methyltransferase
MRLLDVATGTGLVARGGVEILGDPRRVFGVDPSSGMLREARMAVTSPLTRGRAESLPFRSDSFDMLSMGFALRHVDDLEITFDEYRRVLKPGGRILLLEVSRPNSRIMRWVIRTHFQHPQSARRAPHEVLLGHDRPVRVARDHPRCLTAPRLRRREAALLLRLSQRIRRGQVREIGRVGLLRPSAQRIARSAGSTPRNP